MKVGMNGGIEFEDAFVYLFEFLFDMIMLPFRHLSGKWRQT